MSGLTFRTQAMILMKIATEAGAGAQALNIIQTGSVGRDLDSTVNWPAAILELEALVQGLAPNDREALAASIDLAE